MCELDFLEMILAFENELTEIVHKVDGEALIVVEVESL